MHGLARDVLKMPRELSLKSVNISVERGGLADAVVPSAQWVLSEDAMCTIVQVRRAADEEYVALAPCATRG